MSSRLGSALGLVRRFVREVREQEVSFLAAGVAYYAFVSIPPLLLLALIAANVVGGDSFEDAVLTFAQSYLNPTGQDLLVDAVLNARGQRVAGVASAALLLWSGIRLFRGLDEAFAQVYELDVEPGLLDKLVDALTVLVAIAVAVAGIVLLAGVLPTLLVRLPYGETLSLLAIVPMLAVVFFPFYYIFPDVDLEPMEAVPGAVFAAVGWTALAVGFRVYAANAASFRIYGFLGLVILLVTWLYFASTIIILGAVVNAVLTGRVDAGTDAEEPEPDREAAGPAPDITDLERKLDEVRTRLDEKTVSRSDLEGDLRAYVRRRIRRGHARGWGPYLVLLYGTAMTLGAFYYLSGGWAILAMLVVWLSTLGLYVLMLLVGVGIGTLGVPGRAIDWVRSLRS